MAYGSVNVPGVSLPELNEVKTIAEEAKQAAQTAQSSALTINVSSPLTKSQNGNTTTIGVGTIPISGGGTNAITAAQALENLGAAAKNHTHNYAAIDHTHNYAASSHTHSPTDLSSAVPITKGGTGETSVAAARNALGLGNTSGAVPVANGGTGATSAEQARSNIGAASSSHSHSEYASSSHTHTNYATSSHNHSANNITSGTLSTARGGTGNTTGRVTAAQKSGTTLGTNATAEGENATASGECAHAEGVSPVATGRGSHAEGYHCQATAAAAHAESGRNVASGDYSHAEGNETAASGDSSHAENYKTSATGSDSHAQGSYTTAANSSSHAGGKYNKAMTTGGSISNTVGDALVIGNGTSDSALANAFRVTFTGAVYGQSAFKSTGADYAEYFEWLDENPDKEDRVGYFVTMSGKKIRKANAGDYILGIVSGQPCIIGNSDEDWLGRWEHDAFGRFIMEDVESPVTKRQMVEITDENGDTHIETQEIETGEIIHGTRFKANPNYDNTREYVERKDRQEWDAVGMMGVLSVRDDGSCEVDGYCQVVDGGIATKAEKYIPGLTWRVIERVTDNVIKVVFK